MVKRIALLIAVMFSVPIIIGGFGSPQPKADFIYSSTVEHNNRDPQRMTYLHDIRLANALLETLIILDFNDMQVYPGAAETWEISDDGLTYTFHLRDNARWSNGDPVTVHDFIYAWRRAMLPDTAAGYGTFMFFIRGAEDFFHWRNTQLEEYVKTYPNSSGSEDTARAYWHEAEKQFKVMVGLEAPDDHTLIIHLNQRTEYFLQILAFATYMPVHARSVESAVIYDAQTGRLLDDPTYWNDPDRMICNGPYRLKGRKYRQYNYLVANDYYWNRASMKNNSVLELIVNNEESQFLSYENGDIDYVPGVIPEIAYDLIKQNRDDVHIVPAAGTYFYNFNCLPRLKTGEDNPLADWRVRQALAMAIDRNEITHSITRLDQPPAYSFVPPTALQSYHPPVEEGPRFNPQAARALLAEAGFPDGKGIVGLSILYNTNGGHENIAQAIKNMWKTNLGIDVAIDGVEAKVCSARLNAQEYTIGRAAWYGDYPDPTTWLDIRCSNDENNTTKWSNHQYDQLMDKAAHTPDSQQRMQLLSEAESILLTESPMALIYHPVTVALYHSDKIKGLRPNGWNRERFDQISVTRKGK